VRKLYPVQTRRKLVVAVTAMSIAAVGGGIGAAGAQAQNEVLPATTTTFWGGGTGSCFNGTGYANLNAGGSTTGGPGLPAPYPGTFTAGRLMPATPNNVSVSVRMVNVSGSVQIYRTLTLFMPFTINSGRTTITGTVTNPSPYSGGNLGCTGGLSVAAVGVAANAATYTATIQTKGQPANEVSGAALVSAAIDFRPRYVVGTPPTVTLLNFP
jgi:hypothetical protein